MRPYYDLSFVVRPSWGRVAALTAHGHMIVGTTGRELVDATRWKTEPHVAFANLNLKDAKTLAMFMRMYGPVIFDMTDIPARGDRFEVDARLIGYQQERVANAWRTKDAKRLWVLDNVEYLPFTLGGKALQVTPADVFTYVRLLLTRDIGEKKARICANPDCATPYFIARRRDQIYCEWKCANLIMQRNFRKRRKR